jgi:hypothetical protein
MRAKLLALFAHKEAVEDQAEFLLDDRGPSGTEKKYFRSVSQFVATARELKHKYSLL